MNLSQQKVASTLRKHLKLPRKILDPIINVSLEDSNNISFNLSNFSGELPNGLKNSIFFVSPEKEIRLGHLWNYARFHKTSLYSSFMDAYYNIGSDLIFCFVAIDTFTIREAQEYSGTGGIFCKAGIESDTGFIIEPLKNYLENEFPIYWEI